MSVLRKIGLISAVVCSGFLHANTAVDFSAEQNAPCWKMIEQKSTGHCKLYFHRSAPQPAFAPREEVSRASAVIFPPAQSFLRLFSRWSLRCNVSITALLNTLYAKA